MAAVLTTAHSRSCSAVPAVLPHRLRTDYRAKQKTLSIWFVAPVCHLLDGALLLNRETPRTPILGSRSHPADERAAYRDRILQRQSTQTPGVLYITCSPRRQHVRTAAHIERRAGHYAEDSATQGQPLRDRLPLGRLGERSCLRMGASSQGANGTASRLVRAAVVVAVMHSLGACQRGTEAAHIVVHPLPWASHTFGMAKLAAELSRRGHQVRFCKLGRSE